MIDKTVQGRSVRPAAIALLVALFTLVSALQGSAPHLFFARDGFSQALIRDSLERYADRGDSDTGGFMVAVEERVHIAAVREILGPDDPREVYPYIGNANGQYAAGRFLADAVSLSGSRSYVALRLIAVLGMALAVAGIVRAIWRDFGAAHAAAVLGVFLPSALFLERSSSSYWLMFLSFLPFAAMLTLYPAARTGARFGLLALLVAGLVFVKSTTGYEYLTCITLSAMVPVFYHEIADKGYTGRGIAAFLGRAFVVGAACVAGFAAALFLHLDKMARYFGDLDTALSALRLIVSYSVLESESGIRGAAPSPAEVLGAWIDTFLMRNFLVNAVFVAAIGLLAVAMWIGRDRAALRARAARYVRSATFGATVLAFVASASWSVIMIKHGVAHPHINWIQNYLCAYVFLAVSLVQIWQGEEEGAPPRPGAAPAGS